ncbi:MAG: acetylglutamate kinase [Alphaproteobacteria bacterium]
MMHDATPRLSALMTAAPYVEMFRGQVFVVKLGGRLVDQPETVAGIVQQLRVLHAFGIRLCVVHGGGEAATALGEKLGVQAEFVNGRRITDDAMLDVVRMSFAGDLSTRLSAAAREAGLPAVGLTGIDGGLINADRRPPVTLTDQDTGVERDVDFGNVGDVQGIDPAVLTGLMDQGKVPLVASLGADRQGNILNINGDTIAAQLAAALGAAKLVLLTTADGVMRDPSDPYSLISYMDIAECDALMAEGVIKGGMIPKLQTCKMAIEAGVPRAHIVSGLEPMTLLREVFTNEGAGTLLVAGKSDLSPGEA